MEVQNALDRERRQYDALFEKVIKITEDNLKAQNLYLNELTLIKNRFDLNDRDHQDVKNQLTYITNNTFTMLNRMNKASNEDIIKLLSKDLEIKSDFTHRFIKAEEDLSVLSKNYVAIGTSIDHIKEVTDETKASFSLLQKLLLAILVLVTGVQIAAVAWNSIKNQTINKNVKYLIQEELKNNKK